MLPIYAARRTCGEPRGRMPPRPADSKAKLIQKPISIPKSEPLNPANASSRLVLRAFVRSTSEPYAASSYHCEVRLVFTFLGFRILGVSSKVRASDIAIKSCSFPLNRCRHKRDLARTLETPVLQKALKRRVLFASFCLQDAQLPNDREQKAR